MPLTELTDDQKVILKAVKDHPGKPAVVYHRILNKDWSNIYRDLQHLNRAGLVESRLSEGPIPGLNYYPKPETP